MTRAALTASLAVGLFAAPALAADPAGVWVNETGGTRVRVSDCGGGICATVLSTRRQTTDSRNPDPAKRDRPIEGLRIVSGAMPTGPDAWAGAVYNFEDGNTYQGRMELKSADRLVVSGCVLGGLLCETRTWSRVR